MAWSKVTRLAKLKRKRIALLIEQQKIEAEITELTADPEVVEAIEQMRVRCKQRDNESLAHGR